MAGDATINVAYKNKPADGTFPSSMSLKGCGASMLLIEEPTARVFTRAPRPL